INPHTSKNCKIYQDILNTLTAIKPHALPFGNETFIDEIYAVVLKKQNDSDWIRRRYKNINSLQDLVIQQAQLWKNVRS
ncbi:MAG: glutamate--cysteine ligase, partial [Gammaproteobacteria bacterium]